MDWMGKPFEIYLDPAAKGITVKDGQGEKKLND
jgi:hypothetical protein